MANKKFSEFVLKTDTSDVSHIVGYNGAENVQITPANFVTGGGTGVFLPLAGGTMVGNTTHNDNVKSIYGTSGDFEIYHDGSNSYIKESGAGDFRIWADNPNISSLSGNKYFYGNNGSAELYHSGNKKLETSSVGISVTGNGDFTGDVIIDTVSAVSNAGLEIKTANNRKGRILFSDEDLDSVGRLVYDHTTDVMQFFTNNTEHIVVDSSGNVGVGTSSPDKKMTIVDTSAGSVTYPLRLQNSGTTVGTNVGLIFTTKNSGGGSASSIIRSESEDTLGNNSLVFTTPSGGSSAERMRIDSAGNLGVGTSVLQNSAGFTTLSINGSTGGQIAFQKGGVSKQFIFNNDIDLSIYNQEAGNLQFYTNSLERMRLDSSGNLGINEDSPAAKLVVNQDSLVDTEGIFVQAASNPADGGVAIFKSASKVGTISALGGASTLSFMTDGGSEKMRITSAGKVLIATTSTITYADANLQVKADGTNWGASFEYAGTNSGRGSASFVLSGGSTAPSFIDFNYNGSVVGDINTNGTATSYNTTSDYRLKEDLQDFEGLDLVSKIPVYDYKWKADDSRSYGVMAHELEEVLPQAVSGEKDAEEMQSVDYSKIVPLLVKSIQELSAKLEALECQCEKK